MNINYLQYADNTDYFGIKAKSKFNLYKLEEIKQNTDCKIIIINNSSQLNGISKFMKSFESICKIIFIQKFRFRFNNWTYIY
jgi:hypothetical protein